MNTLVDTKRLRTALIVMLATSLLSFSGAWYWFVKAQDERTAAAVHVADQALLVRVAELEKQLASVQESVVPISAAMQALLVKQLTHFHTPVMDALLVKLGPPNTLTEAEEKELIIALEQRTRDMGPLIDDSERDAAMMLPMIIRRVRLEMRTDPSKQRLQTVSLPIDVVETK